MARLRLERNDPRQYDELADGWWDTSGPFAMLHWLAEARAALVPPGDGVLLDLACGGGLMAPHLQNKGYRHVGIDITESALRQASERSIAVVRGNVMSLPFPADSVDVVCAGEILEHVTDLDRAVAESCRVLKPGGLVVIDTIAQTRAARLLAIEVAERVPSGAPPGIHDPELLVDRRQLVDAYANGGVALQLRGVRPSLADIVRWKAGRRSSVRMKAVRSTAVLFQAWGRKAS